MVASNYYLFAIHLLISELIDTSLAVLKYKACLETCKPIHTHINGIETHPGNFFTFSISFESRLASIMPTPSPAQRQSGLPGLVLPGSGKPPGLRIPD